MRIRTCFLSIIFITGLPIWSIWIWRPNHWENDWEQDDAIEQPEHHGEGEHLEEGEEDVAGGQGAEHQRQERGEPAIQDSGANGEHRLHSPASVQYCNL